VEVGPFAINLAVLVIGFGANTDVNIAIRIDSFIQKKQRNVSNQSRNKHWSKKRFVLQIILCVFCSIAFITSNSLRNVK
jgi:hypothetical protein